MLFDDTYKAIAEPAEGLFKDKGSKFIAFAWPILSDAEIKPILLKLRAEHTRANHFCYAYRLSPDRNVFRVNDDGEPSGTAGRPILNMLLSADLTNILIVVVRYFGGTLLGVPGLINAYKSAAAAAVQAARIIEKTVNDRYELKFDYLVMNDVMRLIKEEQLTVLEQHFDNECRINFEVRKSQLNKVLQRIENQAGIAIKYLSTT
ncbi:IMPACT family protein [Pedobacter hartonius]|uniref:Uncharacterized protein, YigZ family n=1 Tax=Pedobacter hartonius TaxID=425514 RepID=A0A1H4HD63_9SPHI|nr:YigZ family protein [Pedobacter hartonius]SEB19390.1 uncharacterized protein, YigZ family [Pedobacter hartonius]